MLDKLLSFTKKNGGCMEWVRCYNTDGYPRMSLGGNSNTKVHRVVYELTHDKSIKGLVIRHKCDNRRCINPDHLEVGSPTDNMLDRQTRQRTHNFMSENEFESIVALAENQRSYTQIAKQLGISRRRVEYALIKRARK